MWGIPAILFIIAARAGVRVFGVTLEIDLFYAAGAMAVAAAAWEVIRSKITQQAHAGYFYVILYEARGSLGLQTIVNPAMTAVVQVTTFTRPVLYTPLAWVPKARNTGQKFLSSTTCA